MNYIDNNPSQRTTTDKTIVGISENNLNNGLQFLGGCPSNAITNDSNNNTNKKNVNNDFNYKNNKNTIIHNNIKSNKLNNNNSNNNNNHHPRVIRVQPIDDNSNRCSTKVKATLSIEVETTHPYSMTSSTCQDGGYDSGMTRVDFN